MFKYFETTADLGIYAEGESLEEAFKEGARGLYNVMVDIDKVDKKEKIEIEVEGEDLEELLYNFLNELLFYTDVYNIVFSDFDIKIEKLNGKYKLKCIAYGEEINKEKHNIKEEVKAVTYHLMEVKKDGNKYIVRFVIDL
ncbi:archease [Methanocaldococcus indicus]|uniref:archease n=1 Tax=Methanocaldococcus indicus TaxID=213231 RepID=UPI003C6D6280